MTLVPGVALPGYPQVRSGLPAARLLRRCWSLARPDVVYVATEGPLGWSAVRIARELGIPVVSGFHTNFHVYARHHRAGCLSPVVLRYLRRFHNRTSGTLVPTADLRAQLAVLGFENLSLLGRGVDGTLFDPARRSASLRAAWGAGDGDLVALYVGRVAPEKNVSLAVGAYHAMRRVSPSARLVVVGDGPLRSALAAAHPDVLFPGAETGERLATHYASADIFLFPSETETFGNVTLEALASGLAVVAYDYAAAHLYITSGESGVLVPLGDSQGFIGAAVGLARSPRQIEAMRREARARALSASWPSVVARFESLPDRRGSGGAPDPPRGASSRPPSPLAPPSQSTPLDRRLALRRWSVLHTGSLDGWMLGGLLLGLVAVVWAGWRLAKAVGNVRALSPAPVLMRLLAPWARTRSYSDEEFFRADGAGEPWVERRRGRSTVCRASCAPGTRGPGSGARRSARASRISASPTPIACRSRSRGSCGSASTSAPS